MKEFMPKFKWTGLNLTIRLIGVLILGFSLTNRDCVAAGTETIVIIKFVTHPALDELESSFIEKITNLAPSVHLERLNANKDAVVAKQLAEGVSARSDVALIVTLATPATQAAAKTPSKIPILYAAVADPVGAGVVSSRTSGIQNADSNIIVAALTTLTNMFPKVTRIGTIYDPTEQNSIFVQAIIKQQCQARGLLLEQQTCSDASELPILLEQMAPKIDALYCANDNTVNKGVFSLGRTAKTLKKPFLIGELSAVEKGPLAGVGVEYRSMGMHLAEMAASILRTGGSSLPPREPAPPPKFWLNLSTARVIGFEAPTNIVKAADRLLP